MKLRSTIALAWLGACLVGQRNIPAQELLEGASDNAVYDKIVEDFILFDIGRIRDPWAVERIKARFNGLRSDDAVPALVRGLNKSTRMRASCPITALASKLRGIVANSNNPEVGSYVLRNLDRANAGPYAAHVSAVLDTAEKQVGHTMGNKLAEEQFRRRAQQDQQRLAYVPGRKLTDLSLRESARTSSGETHDPPASDVSKPKPRFAPSKETTAADPEEIRKMTAEELGRRLEVRSEQVKGLAEFSRRTMAGDEKSVLDQAAAIGKCLEEGDDSARELAARILGQVRSQSSVPLLINAIDDPSPQVRSAAVTALTRTTRQLFGPTDDATPRERSLAQGRWRDWWSKQNKVTDR